MARRVRQKNLGSAFVETRQEYAAMRESRFRRVRPGVSAAPGGADTRYANEPKFIRMREYARAMVDDDAVIKTLVTRAVTNIVRNGFAFEPDTGDRTLDRDLKARWEDWANDRTQCDIAGTLTFPDMERLTAFSELVDGDVFHVGTREGALQTYEAHRCASPRRTQRNIVHGVQLTEKRQRVAYFFKKEPPGTQLTYSLVRDFHEIPAYDEEKHPLVFQVFDPYRFTQTRGVTAFHPVFDKASQLEDIDFALLVKEQAAAMLAWEWQTATDAPPGPPPETGAQAAERQSDGSSLIQEEIAPGSVLNAPPGKKLVMHSPNVPSAETLAHLRQTMQVLALNLGLPLCVGLMDATETNFTGWRGAMDQAKLGWGVNQSRYERMFHRPTAIWKIRDWLSEDDEFGRSLRAVSSRKTKRGRLELFRHWWQKPSWPYPQPLHDAQANAVKVQTGQISLRDLHGENASDFRQFVRDNVADRMHWIARAIRAVEKLKKKFGEAAKDVHWTHLYHCDFVKGAQLIDMIEEPNDGSGEANAVTPARGQSA